MAEGGVAAALAHVAPTRLVAGPLPRHDGRRQAPQQPADGRAPRARRRPTASASSSCWGAVFDRTADGRILQRPFGGHSHPRLAHVGDRTGLEMIRTLQDRAVALGIEVYMECTITPADHRSGRGHRRVRLLADDRAADRLPGQGRSSSRPAASARPTRSPRTRGSTAATARRLAYEAGAELIDMEFVQFHPTGMVWPPGVRGLLVTEAVRGEGGILRNKDGERFMWKYLPEDRRAEYAATDEEAAPLGRRRCPQGQRDRRPAATRAVDPRQRRAGHLHRGPGGPRLAARRRLPRHQLPAGRARPAQAALDVRAVQGAGRRRHHDRADGGRPDDPLRHGRHPGRCRDRRDHASPACSRPARWPAACTARTGSAATRCPTCSCSGPGPGAAAAAARRGQPDEPYLDPVQVQAAAADLAAPLERTEGEDPYAIQRDLQDDDAAPGRHLPRRGGPRRGARASWPSCAGAGRPSGRPAVAPTTRAGTSSSSSATC